MLEVCPRCRGGKQVLGMGCIYRDCEHCRGVGYAQKVEKPQMVEVSVKQEASSIAPDEPEVKVAKEPTKEKSKK